jgi:CRP-like cAMP-binding protein
VNQPDIAQLAKMELFSGVPDQTLAAACATARCEYAAQGHVIFRQGGHAERAYALGEGSVRIVQSGRDGGQVVIRFIGAGRMFGMVPMFTDHVFPSDAIAAERSLVISWGEADLLRLIETCPRAGLNVIRILGARLSEAQERLRELSTQGVERRVASALLRLVQQAGRPVDAGTQIDLRLRRQDLAEVSGTTLHTASRLLAGWQKAGLLSSEHQRLTVRNLAQLRRIADGAKA